MTPLPEPARRASKFVDAVLEMGDDAHMPVGEAYFKWNTDDANANVLMLIFPEGGATDVPVFVIGDATADKDLAAHNGVTEPTVAIWNDAADAYVSLDAGDDAVAGAKGLYFSPAADEDVELININVTGAPRLYWDESQGAIRTENVMQISTLWIDGGIQTLASLDINALNNDTSYLGFKARDAGVGLIWIARLVSGADPYLEVGRDDTGVATNAVTDGLVLQMGAGTNNEAAGQGLGISIKLGNAASELEQRARIDVVMDVATNGSEQTYIQFKTMTAGAIVTHAQMNQYGINLPTGMAYIVNGFQVVGARQVDARIDDVPNSGDATTDGIIAAIQTCLQTHGLMTAS